MHRLQQKLSSKVVTCHSIERTRMKLAKCFEWHCYYSIVLSFDKAEIYQAIVNKHDLVHELRHYDASPCLASLVFFIAKKN